MFRHCHRIIFLIGLTGCFLALNDANCATAPEPGDMRGVGKVEFPISCAPAVQSEFARGVALLHSFFYEEARRVFTAVTERDPKCAMAQWGIAMTWWHPIWTPPTPDEMSAGKAAIEKAMAMNRSAQKEAQLKSRRAVRGQKMSVERDWRQPVRHREDEADQNGDEWEVGGGSEFR